METCFPLGQEHSTLSRIYTAVSGYLVGIMVLNLLNLKYCLFDKHVYIEIITNNIVRLSFNLFTVLVYRIVFLELQITNPVSERVAGSWFYLKSAVCCGRSQHNIFNLFIFKNHST